jgi:transposase-like protein
VIESYEDMRQRHERELAGWVQTAVRGAASVYSAAKRHGVNDVSMMRLWRRLGRAEGVSPRTPETYDEIRARHEGEVLGWVRHALDEHGSLAQVAKHTEVNRGTLSRIIRRMRDAQV